MAVNKNFVVKNGIEIAVNLIYGDSDLQKVGIGSTTPRSLLDVHGDFIAEKGAYITGITTAVEELNVGLGGTALTVLNSSGFAGFNTVSPIYNVEVKRRAGAGDTAAYFHGQVNVEGTLVPSNLRVAGMSTLSNVNIDNGEVEIAKLEVSGLSTFQSAVDVNADLDVDGHTELDNLNVSGVSTFVGFSTFNDHVFIQDGLNVTGVATITDSVIVGGGLTVSGISTFASTVFVGGSSSGAGAATTDYSEVTLSNLSPSSFDQTYSRQSTGFVLDTGTVSSGNALFHADSNYYYYVATTGSSPDSRMLIWSVEDNNWMTVFDFNGTDFSEGNVSNNQAIGSSGIFEDTVTANSITADGRSVPQASSDIVYATSSGGSGSGIGVTITSAGNATFSGIVTAAAFYGDGSNLSGIATELTATIGVGSEGTFIGAGITQLNFNSTNGAAIAVDPATAGIATVTITPGVSLGLAIALGS